MFPQIRCLDCEDIHINCDGCGADFTYDSIEIDGKVWHYCNDRCKERIEATWGVNGSVQDAVKPEIHHARNAWMTYGRGRMTSIEV